MARDFNITMLSGLRIIMRRNRGEIMRLNGTLAALIIAAAAVATAQDQTVRIRAATILDGTGKVIRNATIVVKGSKITSIDAANSGTATYNLGQVTIVPGMIDVHAHV